MPRHLQRPRPPERPRRRLEPSVVGTVALAAVLLVVSGVFLAWGHLDPATDASADPGTGPELVDASGSSSPPTASPTVTQARHHARASRPAPQEVVQRDQVIERIKVTKHKKKKVEASLPTSFRVSTFNVLGASHTAPGERQGWAPGVTRMRWAVQLLQGTGVSVAGLQEFQGPQYNVFRQVAPGWGVYPGPALGPGSLANSIVWRSDAWELVEARTMKIPYFHGRLVAMPYVLLRNLESQRTVWFFNTHNPADAYGPAQQYRNRATALEVQLARTLGADGTPVIFTGDMNDRAPYFCPMTTQTDMHAANGGSTGTSCALPPVTNVDWIMGNTPVTFGNFHSDDGPLVRRTTDHHFVWADATIPAETTAAQR